MNYYDWYKKDSEVFLAVRTIVNKYDLENMIRYHSPEDEYDPEVIDILNRCDFITDKEEMVIALNSIFTYWFQDSEYSTNVLNAMADELMALFNPPRATII